MSDLIKRLRNNGCQETQNDIGKEDMEWCEDCLKMVEAADALEKAQAEIDRLQSLHLARTKSTHKALTDKDQRIDKLEADLKAANARERPAFMAGISIALSSQFKDGFDEEHAWQQYRCQDGTDWKVTE